MRAIHEKKLNLFPKSNKSSANTTEWSMPDKLSEYYLKTKVREIVLCVTMAKMA